MKKIQKELEETSDRQLISYGCAAHVMNLFAHDVLLQFEACKEKFLGVIKYFRNHHLPSAKYSEAGGSALVMPNEVRWNSMSDCLTSFIRNWQIMCTVCSENPSLIEKQIANLVQNFDLKRKAEDLLKLLKPISVALDRMQKDSTSIADSVSIWKELETQFESCPDSLKKIFKDRLDMVLTPAHWAAFLLHPSHSEKLNEGRVKVLIIDKIK